MRTFKHKCAHSHPFSCTHTQVHAHGDNQLTLNQCQTTRYWNLLSVPLPGILISHMGNEQTQTHLHTLFPWMRRWLIKTELSAQSKFTVSLQDSGNYTHIQCETRQHASSTQTAILAAFSRIPQSSSDKIPPYMTFCYRTPVKYFVLAVEHFSIHMKVLGYGM